ncbi:Mce protein [Mycobacterium sp. 852002-51152_SCH6134967]|uniref:tetratricopeptide repeat protein n=1 Tax=Mycobacterium sp. 852002-51152_SCH6134967 TaxID=1834096 RepID=UPI0007FEED33|nr:tetratricopeptide repeat protein [Mycobacterium sp. 852002-51152_SCH6134967]OBF89577.1 Mce protein [Mycobacterium sp. 852002-51152_SCH6134967]
MADETTPGKDAAAEGPESTTPAETAPAASVTPAASTTPTASTTEAAETTEAAGGVEAAGGAEDYDAAEDDAEPAPPKAPMSHVRLATIVGLVVVVALAALAGWLGYRAYESRQAEDLRNLFLQVGRQGALNLTTISHEHAEQDVQRVLDSSTGTFYDDFQARAQPFVEVVKQAQSKSEGEIAEAGIESLNDNEAKVLVAVTVNTTNAGAPEQAPRSWRMRISVQKTGEDEAKISNVEFVP